MTKIYITNIFGLCPRFLAPKTVGISKAKRETKVSLVMLMR